MKTFKYAPDGTVCEVHYSGYYQLYWEGTVYCGYHGEDKEFFESYQEVKDVTSMAVEKLWIIYLLAKQSRILEGSFFECGVFRGGSAKILARLLNGSEDRLHLFDTWTGMPEPTPLKDWHKEGDFKEVDVEEVRRFMGPKVSMHQGLIPETFKDFEGPIAFAHCDVDLYQSMKDCCEFIYPRLSKGGVMVFDDYGQQTCFGAKEAIDEFFEDKSEIPLSMLTTQAMIFKL